MKRNAELSVGVNMSFEPTQTCQACGDVEVVRPDGRGFPPDIAKRRLAKRCKANGHTCDPKYRAGFRWRNPANIPDDAMDIMDSVPQYDPT
jgi:hypothetical protein